MEITDLQFSRWHYGDSSNIRLKVAVSGSDDESEVLLYAQANTLPIFQGLYRGEMDGELVGPEEWDVTVDYTPNPPPVWNSTQSVAEWQFSIDEETVHRTHALAHVATYPAGADEHDGAVNVNPDGSVDGYDESVSTLTWSETLYLPWSMWGTAYLNQLYAARGCYNSTAFRIWEAGEVLLRRVAGRPHGQSHVAINFDFVATPNVTGLTVGDITGIDKLGWDLEWTEYVPTSDDDSNSVQVKAVHIERVKYSYEFHDLGLLDPFA